MEHPPIESKLNFEVRSGLKSILGSELITDEQVAIFELVKNAFDAQAQRVDLYFDSDRIIIADDGDGMSLQDIKHRWLLVAYSEKRNAEPGANFRDNIASRRAYAGNKGIGRFSADSLGSSLNLQTKPKSPTSEPVHSVTVNWDEFDDRYNERFEKLELDYTTQPNGFVLPDCVPKPQHGTAISIYNPRHDWDRRKLLKLKSELAKLINPFGDSADNFRIVVHAPAETKRDAAEPKLAEHNPNDVVNGEVGNFIFTTLSQKTTFLEVKIVPDQNSIESTLVDRGELIYHILEPNKYERLVNSGFRCQLFFLNQAAKVTFKRRMGVPSVQFGSVFVFRNGIRVYPIGNEGDDWFGMDRRKQQGYRRFLGTRDVIGRIDITARSVHDFQEASSRNDGLIESDEVTELLKCFRDQCLIRLERYIVPVTFSDPEDKLSEDITRLLTDAGKTRVSTALAKLIDDNDVELLDYSPNLVKLVDERSSHFESSLGNLRAIAAKTENPEMFRTLEQAERRFQELKRSAETAQNAAAAEREAKEQAQTRAEVAEQHAAQATTSLHEEQKRNLFLTSITALDFDTILNLHHQVSIYSIDIQQQIENFLVQAGTRENLSRNEVSETLESIAFLNRKVMSIAKFATKANFRLESERIEADLAAFIEQYIIDVAADFFLVPTQATVSNDEKGVSQRFKPIDVAIVIDNLISNARRARATKVHFEITHPAKGTIYIKVTDDGRGLNPSIDTAERIFEKGFTTTHGSGLGLYHVRQVLSDMGGTIEIATSPTGKGMAFLIRITNAN